MSVQRFSKIGWPTDLLPNWYSTTVIHDRPMVVKSFEALRNEHGDKDKEVVGGSHSLPWNDRLTLQ